MTDSKVQKIVVSGMRPTGRLHLGHLHGVIENYVKLQNDESFAKRFYFVADLHALTTEYDNTAELHQFSHEVVLDWLAAGVDPNKAVIFVQSKVPEHSELHVLLSMIAPISWLERVPSYKDLQQELKEKDLSTLGFLGYPVLQTADVALYNGSLVPVGQDQVPHIEFSRELVRRFNHIFKSEVLVEPQPLLTKVPKLLGTDGRKMSKSFNNSIYLADTKEVAQQKVKTMMTDPARQRKTDKGDPAKCPVFDYHKLYSTPETCAKVTAGCTSAGIGCIECKKWLVEKMDEYLDPLREKRAQLTQNKKFVEDVIREGCEKAGAEARKNLERIKQATHV